MKIAENTKGPKPTWPHPSTWSITGRLTALYALSAFGMLVLATGFLYWVLASDLEAANNQFLSDRIQVLRAILHEHPEDWEGLEEEVKSPGAYYIRILDGKQKTLIETPDMNDIIYISLFPPPIGIKEMPVRGVKQTLPDGRSYLLSSAWARFGPSPRNKRLIQVALDVSSEEALIISYRHKLSVVLLCGILFSAGAGVAVTRKGMRPLKEITQTAERITAIQLHERIDPARWPKELTALATAFDQMLNRLEESFTRLSQFSADLAHELRTPINNLMGGTEVALSRTRTPPEYREVLESGLEEYQRLSRTIDGLLFLARAENPESTIERAQLDARKEIEAVVEFHEAMAQEQGVEVTCQGDAPLKTDPILFRRAMSNLLSNALQYTPRGGKVTISIKSLENRDVEVTVSDTGSGIAPEHLPKIFDRFYRADRARSQSPKGIGLGLAIVKSIIESHGGTVAIHSEPSKGTKVILRFPS